MWRSEIQTTRSFFPKFTARRENGHLRPVLQVYSYSNDPSIDRVDREDMDFNQNGIAIKPFS